MGTAGYSKLVLDGLELRGIDAEDVSRITGVGIVRLKKIHLGKASFTDKQLDSIEQAAGMTAGQLAILAIPEADERLTSVIEALAECRVEKPTLVKHT